MPKYLCRAKYTVEGAQGLMEDGGSGRRSAVDKAVKGLGGKIECFYYAFGDTDVYIILDFPDAVSAAALSIAVNAAGGAQVTVTPLLTVEEIDAACKKSVAYRAPGG
jgi:uncharacterized protein with GYD domain